ncbi:MAG TPA: site-2 protease family protein [Lacunisphaera sp.]|nr:site-2 protease family protein [Lacunisphaera sp.]
MFGIQLAVHASFVLLLAYYAWQGWIEGGLAGLFWRTTLIVLFFVCVVLHELGHSLTARRFGVRVPRILLLPIGGMAEFDHIPRKPAAELLITVAGPAVNFALALALLGVVWRGLFGGAAISEYSVMGLLDELWFWNLVMGIFNLLPVFPMDGGRILRALLAFRLPYLRATWWAAVVSKILAPLLACVAFFYLHQMMLGILFLFILFVGDAEYRQTLRREQEERYWADMLQRMPVAEPVRPSDEPPLLSQGPN